MVGWPNKLGIRLNSAKLKLARLGLSLAKFWVNKNLGQKNLGHKKFWLLVAYGLDAYQILASYDDSIRRNEIVDSILVGMKWFIPFQQEKGAAMSKLVDY